MLSTNPSPTNRFGQLAGKGTDDLICKTQRDIIGEHTGIYMGVKSNDSNLY